MRSWWILLLAPFLAVLHTPCSHAADGVATDRWYELLRQGQKIGYSRVRWAPSTWESRHTVHDTTTQLTRTVRNMSGYQTVFVTQVTINLERDDDGSLWWMHTLVEEEGRLSEEEITWTGAGYRCRASIADTSEEFLVRTAEPVVTDAEAFVGSLVRARTVSTGERFSLRELDLQARTVREGQLTILGGEILKTSDEVVACHRMVELDPRTGAETLFWIDLDGAYVQMRSGGLLVHRVPRGRAEELPAEPPVFTVTTPASPPLERIFSADRTLVDVHLQGDRHRKLPDFPASPWSRVLGVEGSDDEGWVVHVELRSYDRPEVSATIPVAPEGFERELEATPLMPCHHPRIQATASEIVGACTDAREAAWRIARFVWGHIGFGTPGIGELTALEILDREVGDCSEHALLFTTLCRAAGIPTRRCSGYVCIGDTWGAHAWCEIWVGDWIGADPTTSCIGTSARYLFFGYNDLPGSFPGEVSSRAAGRLRFVTLALDEGEEHVDLRDPTTYRVFDRATRKGAHNLAGLAVEGVPGGWRVSFHGDGEARLATEGLDAMVSAQADQGLRELDRLDGVPGTFAGVAAKRFEHVQNDGSRFLRYMLLSRRRYITVRIRLQASPREAELLETLERILAPTFVER